MIPIVALDDPDASEARSIVARLGRVQPYRIEFGTPLVAAWGMIGCQTTARSWGLDRIHLDAKVMDFPASLESLIDKHTTSSVTAMACAGIDLVHDAARVARRVGFDLYVSFMGVEPSSIQRLARDLDAIVPLTLIAHGRGQPARAFDSMISQLIQLQRHSRHALIAAGGIHTDVCGQLKPFDLASIIIGRGVTAAANPGLTLWEIMRRLE